MEWLMRFVVVAAGSSCPLVSSSVCLSAALSFTAGQAFARVRLPTTTAGPRAFAAFATRPIGDAYSIIMTRALPY